MALLALVLISAQLAGAPIQEPQAGATAELSIEAGVQLRNGDVKRVARTLITLLDADFGDKLLAVHPTGIRNVQLQTALYLTTKRLAEMERKPSSEQTRQMGEFLKTHTIASAMTDFDGKAIISAPPGKYFVFCAFELGAQYVVWSVPVELKSGKQAVILDHNNTR
ncbi:MAG TPA: hypothetical protein VNJ04_04085 [Gemmatimonadaceae bacterium]|nr:hypothetical protein [Gemmatimonadaceae bacterium]